MWDQRNSGIRNMVERGADALLSLGCAEELPAAAVAVASVIWPWLVSYRNTPA